MAHDESVQSKFIQLITLIAAQIVHLIAAKAVPLVQIQQSPTISIINFLLHVNGIMRQKGAS